MSEGRMFPTEVRVISEAQRPMYIPVGKTTSQEARVFRDG